jgi:mono/diheme cytochrome c family protein
VEEKDDMQRFTPFRKRPGPAFLGFSLTASLALADAVACLADLPASPVSIGQVARGRVRVMAANCASCHSRGKQDPSDPNWLAGHVPSLSPTGEYTIGTFKTRAANLTPDPDSGTGHCSPRQIFNALRYGLDPEYTPDVVITSSVPGQGNHPSNPHYLAPPMPWPAFRHLPDEDIWAIAAYLKHGIKPVKNVVPDSEGPADFWASNYDVSRIGPYPPPPYPGANEEFRP